MPPRGPKPKPRALKLVDGNPGKRKLTANEPRLPGRKLKCPKWLSKEAKREWRRIVPTFERLGWVSEQHLMALAMLFQSWARWREAEEFIERNGTVWVERETVTDPETKAQVQKIIAVNTWPQVGVSLKYGQQCRLLCAEFGLTLSSSGRIDLPKGAARDGMEGLLGQQAR